MWRVNVPNHVKVAVTRFSRTDADLVFAGLRAEGYLIFFDLIRDQRTVNVTAVERPH